MAYKVLDLTIDKQAYYLSYLDTFRLISIFFILVLPLVAFLRTKNKNSKQAKAPAAEGH